MTAIIRPLWSFVKIDLNIHFTANKLNMLVLSIICQHNSQCIIKNREQDHIMLIVSKKWLLNVDEMIFTKIHNSSNNF